MDDNDNNNWLSKIFSFFKREPKNKDEIVDLLRDATEREVLDSKSLSMIEGVLDVENARVKDVMIPKAQMITVQKNQPLSDVLKTVIDSGHSRFPVTGENPDEIIGILLAKDMLPFCYGKTNKQFDINKILRPSVVVPESKRLDTMLQDFRDNRSHIAIIVDEYGGITGLITIEDVLEQIVGDIIDEYDSETNLNIKLQADGSYLVKATTSLSEFNDFFESNVYDEDSETLGGIVVRKLGSLPKKGEEILIDDFKFSVMRSDNRRVQVLKVIKKSVSTLH